MRKLPRYPLPEGFSVRPIRGDQLCLWTDIWRDAEDRLEIPDDLILREFSEDLAALSLRCFLVFNRKQCAIATATAWYSDDFREGRWGRVHWVAVRPGHQGKGIARGLMSHVMDRMRQWHDKAWLSTSSTRLKAIRIYLDFGFEPVLDHPGGREAWTQVASRLNHPALEAPADPR
jgi:GNAT superfamily N-acetyltransferase